MRDGGFAVHHVYPLPRTVQQVGTQRQADGALFGHLGWQWRFEQCHILFLYSAVVELCLQMLVNPFGLGYHKHTRCGHVKPMDDEWPVCLRAMTLRKLPY